MAIASKDAETAIALIECRCGRGRCCREAPGNAGADCPAREQLGEILLASGRPTEALREFHAALQAAPRRRGALIGAAAAEANAKQRTG